MNKEYTEWLGIIQKGVQRVGDIMLNERDVVKARKVAEQEIATASIFLIGTLVRDDGGSLSHRCWDLPKSHWTSTPDEDDKTPPA